MKLTLTREQIPLARETVAWLRKQAGHPGDAGTVANLPGYHAWMGDGVCRSDDDTRWADALEAAITEAEHPMQVITLAKVGDADERAFWREVFMWGVSLGHGLDEVNARANEALARYRKAFGGEA